MRLTFVSEKTLQDLKVNSKAYLKKYYSGDGKWFDTYFSEEGKVLETNIEFDMPELSYDDDYSISDQYNVRAIYNSLSHLPVTLATQERMWTGLAHNQFRDFTFYRLRRDIEEKNESRMFSSLFFKHGTKRSLFVHILSRLWWVGYMTYDASNDKNPYWLTDFFTERDFSARSVIFFSSNFTSNRTITIGILKALYKIKEDGVAIKREHFLQATKYLNILGGAMILDLLSVNEVEELVAENLNDTFNLSVQERVEA
ncbi:hypothetical protein QOZ98_002251 [Planomicrobium stackebrandtii]|uniref:Uncharacterized protein n=1 Tax=Planomicrobium stackebrandtii TaxID=253160 RepID=A0ABU0GVM9_9BACL|nr:DUF6339 family protein [Planomicrobium stackebrandtii]MDQ0429423.1 hypothetical protein [Planomicrobium stackebrandtii]